MTIYTLDVETIFYIHKQQIDLFSGEHGYYDHTQDKVWSILLKQVEMYYGYEPYPSIFDKASMLLFFFAKDHCFRDGNKRVALASCILFLELNGYIFVADENEAEEIVVQIAGTEFRGDTHYEFITAVISKWIENNVQIEP